jgi:quercetin dioxygenase-like cupin family protein
VGEQRRERGEEERVEEHDAARQEHKPTHGRAVYGGPVWGTETDDLNATILEWRAGGGPPEHVNAERDVVLVVLAGSATVEVDGEAREAGAGEVVVLPKGARRRIAAGPDGVRYVTVHRRRGGLSIATLSRPR